MFSGKGALYSKQSQNKKKRARMKYAFLGLFIVIGIGAGLYSIPRYEEFMISSILISGQEVLKKEEIERITWENLKGNKYFFFPNKNIFLYPKELIKKTLEDFSPYILMADVEFSNFKTISIEVTERKPFALWCGNNYEVMIENNCYFLDKVGFIFDNSPIFTGNTYIRYFGTTTEPYIKSQFLNPILFQSVSRLIHKLAENAFITTAVYFKSSEEIIIYLDNGSRLIYSQETDNGKIVSYLVELVRNPDFKGKDKDGKLTFSYIDFRFGNKIFYKP